MEDIDLSSSWWGQVCVSGGADSKLVTSNE